MTDLASDLISRVQTQLLSGVREAKNKLGSSVSAGATSLSMSMQITSGATAVPAGAVISVDLERFYVWSVNAQASTLTVEPGWDGTTQASHTSGAIVTVNSRCDQYSVLRAINDDLAALSSPLNGLYQVRTVEVAYSSIAGGYDITGATNIEQVYTVEARYTYAAHDWQVIPHGLWRIERSQNLTDFPSGYALFSAGGQPGQNFRVTYFDKFAPLVAVTDNVQSVTGLPATANDIPVLGAIERLWSPREMKRNFTESQVEPRHAAEVPPGAVLGSSRAIAALRLRRVAEEAARFKVQYPQRATAV